VVVARSCSGGVGVEIQYSLGSLLTWFITTSS
jgi:hypothetical protein